MLCSIYLLSKCHSGRYFYLIRKTFQYKMSSLVPLFSTDRKRVLMTGFTPFEHYETNPSWEGVQFMDGSKIETTYNITLFRKEIPVSYEAVDEMVPQMWYWYQPHLTIHVGLNEEVQSFALEKHARKRGYIPNPEAPTSKEIYNPAAGDNDVETSLDIEKICRKFNSCRQKLPDPELHAKSSDDAGRFVCEYIYYTSLCHRRGHTLFVHVPLKKYSSEQLARGLERIMELCLKQLRSDPDLDYPNGESGKFAMGWMPGHRLLNRGPISGRVYYG